MAKLLLGSVVGPQGPQGTPGVNGSQGPQGIPGPSEIAATTNVTGLTSGRLLYNNGGKVGSVEIVDDLTSTATDKPLSANKGRVLKDYVDSAIGQIGNDLNAHKAESEKDNAIVLRPTGSDDTSLINDAINTVITGARLKKVILDGAFIVSTQTDYSQAIKMKSGVILEFAVGAKVTMAPNNFNGYEIISCRDIQDFKIINPYIIGDMDTHTGTTGTSGMGIMVAGCKNYEILNIYAEQCWGDGLFIKNSYVDNSISENGYIDKVKMYRCRRNGVVISSARNLTIDYIECSEIFTSAPKAAVDIETHYVGEVLDNVKIGKIKSTNCHGGVRIQPLGMSQEAQPVKIGLEIEQIELLKGNGDAGGFIIDGVDPDKVLGKVKIGYLYIDEDTRPIVLRNILNGGIEVDIKDTKFMSVSDGGNFAMDTAILVETDSKFRISKNIGKITFDNIDGDCQTHYFLVLLGQLSGTIEPSNFKINRVANRVKKPMRLDGKFNNISDNDLTEANILDLITTYNPGGGWFSLHFLSSVYHNEGATADKTVAPSGYNFNMKNTPIALENRTGTYYLGVDLTGKAIHPLSLGFTNGFKSNELGAKITFVQKEDGTVFVLNKLGNWVTR